MRCNTCDLCPAFDLLGNMRYKIRPHVSIIFKANECQGNLKSKQFIAIISNMASDFQKYFFKKQLPTTQQKNKEMKIKK